MSPLHREAASSAERRPESEPKENKRSHPLACFANPMLPPPSLGPALLTCTHRLPHNSPLLGAGIMGVGPERVSSRNHTLFLCLRLRRLFNQWAAQAGSTHAISSAVPHAVTTRGYERRELRSKMTQPPEFSQGTAPLCRTVALGGGACWDRVSLCPGTIKTNWP